MTRAPLPYGRQWIDEGIAIRCLDCGTLLCPHCARLHFSGDEKNQRIATLEAQLKVVSDALVASQPDTELAERRGR